MNISLTDKEKDISLSLVNINALAQLENGYDECHLDNYGCEPRTESCILQLGGGWFTGSVQRVVISHLMPIKHVLLLHVGWYFIIRVKIFT